MSDPSNVANPERSAEGSTFTWWRDRWLWGALAVALVLRVFPLVVWHMGECVRDECIYRSIAGKIVGGKGLTTSTKGWLPAPGIPYLLAWMKITFGTFQSIKVFHVIVSLVSTLWMYFLGRRLGGRSVARYAAWLFAAHPTLAWFTNTMWIETLYIFFLLTAILTLLWAKDRTWAWMILAGVALGFAVLFRGVATYLPPFFLLAIVYPTAWNRQGVVAGLSKGWQPAIGFVIGLLITVAPYSISASQKHGGFMVTDATAGHVLYLGNNDFPPLTFDYGNGMLTQPIFQRYLRIGRRPPCPRNQPPVLAMDCESEQAVEWIKDNPREFVSRVPLRLAQLFNPHSFLTRHVRWGFFPGLPWLLKEALVFWIAATSAAIMIGGTIGAWARARGAYGSMAVGTVVYTIATISILYGMTRFRLPLEPLWMLYLALLIDDPRGSFDALQSQSWRMMGLLLTLPPLLMLMAWFTPTGWPLFW